MKTLVLLVLFTCLFSFDLFAQELPVISFQDVIASKEFAVNQIADQSGRPILVSVRVKEAEEQIASKQRIRNRLNETAIGAMAVRVADNISISKRQKMADAICRKVEPNSRAKANAIETKTEELVDQREFAKLAYSKENQQYVANKFELIIATAGSQATFLTSVICIAD